MGKKYNNSMSSTLIESFGYEPQLDELSLSDVGDFGRGALHGATFGFNNNITAGVKSLFKGSKYKDELQKQVQADREAEERSPKAYFAGDIAGSFAAPLPGSTALKGAMAASKFAKSPVANVAANLAHRSAVTAAGNAASDAATAHTLGDTDKIMRLQQEIGTRQDGKFGPDSREKLKLWQQQNGLPPTGVPDKDTMDIMGIDEAIAKIEQNILEGWFDKAISKGIPEIEKYASSGLGKARPFIRNLPSNASVPATTSKAGEFIPKSNLPATAAQAAEKDAIDSTATGFNVAKVPPKEGEFIPKDNVTGSASQAAEKDAIDLPASDYKVVSAEQKAMADTRLSQVDKANISKNGIKSWVTKNPKKASVLGYLALLGISQLGDDDGVPATPGSPGIAPSSSATPGSPGIAPDSKGIDPSIAPTKKHTGAQPAPTSKAKTSPKPAQPHARVNPDVIKWQKLLNANGEHLKVTGIMDKETIDAYERVFGGQRMREYPPSPAVIESSELDRIVKLARG